MAVPRSNLTAFTDSWNKTVAWAQTQGISKNSYYPIYQMDSARLLANEPAMSQAERTRAILAAHNPNQVTPVPGDKPNPTNILGNAVTDLRSIFTGLAPNHIIPNIFDTVKNTVMHPATVTKPLGDIVGGALTGNVGQVKQGLELASGITGPGSILSWLPGVYVGGELAQGGLSEVLAHPVIGFIDVAPFAPAGRIIDAAATASRSASIAAKLGMTTEELRNASFPGMAKSFAMTRKVGDVPFVKSHMPSLVDAKGKPLTIGSALDTWITAHTGMGKTLSSLMKGMLNINDTETDYELAMMRPAELALSGLTDAQRHEVDGLLSRKDPRAKGKTPFDIANDERIDPTIRTAYSALERTRQWEVDTALASRADVAFQRPDGSTGIVHAYGDPSPIIKTRDTLQSAQDKLISTMEPSHKLTMEIKSWDTQLVSLSDAFGKTIPQAEAAAHKLDGQERVVIDSHPGKLGAKTKVKSVTLDIRSQVKDLFGEQGGLGDITKAEGGVLGRIQEALGQKDYAGLKEYTAIAQRRLDFANYKLREGRADDPALIALSGQINALHEYAVKRLEYEKRFLARFKEATRSTISRKRTFVETPKGKFEDLRSGQAGRRVGGMSELAKPPPVRFGESTIDPAVERRYEAAKTAFNADLTNEAARREFDAASKARVTARRIPGEAIKPTEERLTKDMRSAFKAYLKARREFSKAVWDHPTADWIDVVRDKFVEKLMEQEDRYKRFGTMTKVLRDAGVANEAIDALRADPQKMAQLIEMEVNRASSSPYGEEIMTRNERDDLWKSAIDAANQLRAEGHEVVYIPSVSTLDLRDTDPGRYGIHLSSTGKVKRSSRGFERQLKFVAQRHDVVAGIHQGAKEALQIRGTIEFVDKQLTPHFVYSDEIDQTIKREFPDRLLTWNPQVQTLQDLYSEIARDNFGLVAFNPQTMFGFTMPRWKEGQIYLPKGIADALPKMLDKGQFPLDGALDKATGVFRFAILGLSPRYTAHVVFGGTFLLALRSSPRLLAALPEAWKIIHDNGDVPREAISRGATQRGVDPVVYKTFNDSPRNVANRAFLHRSASQALKWINEEHIEKVQGVKLAAAQPIHWLKAVGDANYKFTNAVADFQRAWAYSDFLMGAKKGKLRDPSTGESLDWTDARVRRMAEHHVSKTLGDLKAMTPLERAWFSKLMPFYGWTKHILEFTGSYPADHPFRASALTVMAVQDSNSVSSGLPKRLQFLLFLGSPDVAGNVSATDVRFLDPLRDVANYATWQGWISALNPILSLPIAQIDPQAIYGGVPLYPNVTYDQFYGIETSASQGSPLTAVEQIIPQVGALDAALGLSAQYRNLAATNPNSFAKAIFQSLNVPFAQVQHLNLKQIAAKNELDRYQVAKQASTNAFDSGDFSAISGLSSVPDPLNTDWNVTPGYLQKLYNQLLQQYPGQPPSSTALPPPPAPI